MRIKVSSLVPTLLRGNAYGRDLNHELKSLQNHQAELVEFGYPDSAERVLVLTRSNTVANVSGPLQ
jgi:hypothetical protein